LRLLFSHFPRILFLLYPLKVSLLLIFSIQANFYLSLDTTSTISNLFYAKQSYLKWLKVNKNSKKLLSTFLWLFWKAKLHKNSWMILQIHIQWILASKTTKRFPFRLKSNSSNTWSYNNEKALRLGKYIINCWSPILKMQKNRPFNMFIFFDRLIWKQMKIQ